MSTDEDSVASPRCSCVGEATSPKARDMGFNVLHLAIVAGHNECLQQLLKHEATRRDNLNGKCVAGFTPLMTAIIRQQPQCVKTLLAHSECDTRITYNGLTALLMAAVLGHAACLDCFLTSCPAKHVWAPTDANGHSALAVAALSGKQVCFEKLLAASHQRYQRVDRLLQQLRSCNNAGEALVQLVAPLEPCFMNLIVQTLRGALVTTHCTQYRSQLAIANTLTLYLMAAAEEDEDEDEEDEEDE